MATVYGYMFLLFTTFPTVFQQHYGFSIGIIGLTYVGIGIGLLAGLIFVGMTRCQAVGKM